MKHYINNYGNADMDDVDGHDADDIAYDTIETGQTNEYYQGQAERVLKHIDTTEHYHFVNTILKDYTKLTDTKKKSYKKA